MSKVVFLIVALFLSSSSFATKIVPTPTNELVEKSDYVLIGTVKDIRLYNKNGKEKKWFNLVTGPGIENTLYHYIEIDKEHILKTSGGPIPDLYKAKIWNMWHKELKDERDMYLGKKVVLFLKGSSLEPVSIPEYIHLIYTPEFLTEIQELVEHPKK